jgi:hypothetical protein
MMAVVGLLAAESQRANDVKLSATPVAIAVGRSADQDLTRSVSLAPALLRGLDGRNGASKRLRA